MNNRSVNRTAAERARYLPVPATAAGRAVAVGIERRRRSTAATAPASVSVNGGRGRANNFSVNGGDANDQFVNLPTDSADAGCNRGISRYQQHVRRGVWAQFGRCGERGHKVGNEPMARQRVRVFPQQGAECTGLFFNTVQSRNSTRTSLAERSAARSGRTAPSSLPLTKGAGSGRANLGTRGGADTQERPSAAQGGSIFAGGFPSLWSDGVTPMPLAISLRPTP